MKKLDAADVRELNLLKHYRTIRKWACKTNNIQEADLELLIYFDCLDLFTKNDYKTGVLAFSWDNKRWNRLLKEGWITVWRKRNMTTQKYHIYKTSFKCRQLITRIYKMMLNKEEIPLIKNPKSYTEKVLTQAIKKINYGSK
jgi:hypothetical protein|tara:strand:- start:368 stop:793 length:426 start_codon:yes stop_codon:yes gene_type:complete